MIGRILFALVVAAFPCTGQPVRAQPAPAPYHYWYFKEQIELPLDATRLALLQSPVTPRGQIAAALARAGLDVGKAEPWAISGWSLVDVPQGRRSAAEIEGLVVGLAADPAFEFVSPVFIGNDGGPVFITPRLMIGFSASVELGRVRAILEEDHAGPVTDQDWAGMAGVYRTVPASRDGFAVLAAANRLAQRGETTFAEPDVIFTGRGDEIPNDPGFPNCWGLHNTGQFGGTPDKDMDAPEAWDITKGDPSIVVVVIDTGVQQNHPDINQRAGADFTGQGGGGGPFNSCDNHGTAVAGCISAKIGNGLGTVGIAPQCLTASARAFISTTACDGGWTAIANWTVAALSWAESIGARVTNNSNSYGFTSAAIELRYAQTRAAGIVHFASAGNNSSGALSYPSSIPAVNAVASLAPTGTRSGFSNYGPGLDFSAPGQTIYTTDRTGTAGWEAGDYTYADGTSFASPYAAGVGALVLSRRPALTAAQVEGVLQQSCVDLGTAGYDTDFGWGFVNARNAVVMACPADINHDGFLDGIDYDQFNNAFEVGNGAADYNRDGFVDGIDYDMFNNDFEAGC